jgi:hypothetical protein
MTTTATERQPPAAEQDVLRFVQLCLRSRWEAEALEAARRLAMETQLDWEALVRVAEEERLGPLLYRAVRRQDLVPPAVEEALRAVRYSMAVRDRLLHGELAAILDRLSVQGVDVVLLKGAALVHTVYGGAGLRPMEDLDVLVHREDVRPTLAVLIERGYQRAGIEVRPDADLLYENELKLDKAGPLHFWVEVHWSLFDMPYYQRVLPMDWFWQTALPVRIGDTAARVLGPEAQTLHLCGHIMLQHGDERASLLWLHDVAEVLVHYRDQLDWEELLNRAQEFRLVLPVQQVVGRVAEQWGVPVPAQVLSRLNALRPSADEVRVVAWRTARQRPVAQRFWSDLAGMGDWRQRLHYVWIQLFPSVTYMVSRYGIKHRLLVPLYYPYRWLVGLRGVRTALRR